MPWINLDVYEFEMTLFALGPGSCQKAQTMHSKYCCAGSFLQRQKQQLGFRKLRVLEASTCYMLSCKTHWQCSLSASCTCIFVVMWHDITWAPSRYL